MVQTGRDKLAGGVLLCAAFIFIISAFCVPETLHAANPFETTLRIQGITFHVTCPNSSSLNDITIAVSGLESGNSTITASNAGGIVTGAQAADLNNDGSPEIYVYLTSAGSGSYGSVIAYGVNRRKSLSGIYMPPISRNRECFAGYMGHDRFCVVGNRLARLFPVYLKGDPNAGPAGGIRLIAYSLVAGEAGWRLQPVKCSRD